MFVAACAKPAAPPTPAPAPPPAKHYGPIMVAVAHHHEMLGRALVAGRWALADYALRELHEAFEELALAQPPEEAHANLLPLAESFPQTHLPPLERAVAARDLSAAMGAYASASRACNACHATAGFAFLVVPEAAGEPVPTIAPEGVTDAAMVTDAAVVTDAVVMTDAVVRRLPGAGGACDDRVGCARGLICCTHGGIAMPATHHGRCMTFRGCNTQPAAHPGR